MAKAAKKTETEMNNVVVSQLPAIREAGQLTLEDRKQQADEIIEMSSHWATRLMEVVDRCGLSKTMSGKKYLEVEGWLLISEFAHVRPVIEWVRPWMDEGKLFGYEARCQLINDDGQVIGAGESSCGLDAFPCRGKQGSEKDKAAKSAAQTWAISRALRNKFSYVAKIAGYQAVPAEEMYHGEAEASEPLKKSVGDLLVEKDRQRQPFQGIPPKPDKIPDFDPPKSAQPLRQLSKAHTDLRDGIEQYLQDNPDHGMATNDDAFGYILKDLTRYDAYYHKTDPCPVCQGKLCPDCGMTGKRKVPANLGQTRLEELSDKAAGAALGRFRKRLEQHKEANRRGTVS